MKDKKGFLTVVDIFLKIEGRQSIRYGKSSIFVAWRGCKSCAAKLKDLREELTRDNDARKHKGLPTVEDKIDNTLTMAVAVYDRLNQIEYALRSSTPKSEIIAWLKSVWSGVRRFCSKQPAHWYRNPYILCAISICLLYFALSIFSWQQWHDYRDENTRLRLTADRYRVDSIIIRELYPQAAITLSAYEHIAESEGTDKVLQTFRENIKDVQAIKKPLE